MSRRNTTRSQAAVPRTPAKKADVKIIDMLGEEVLVTQAVLRRP